MVQRGDALPVDVDRECMIYGRERDVCALGFGRGPAECSRVIAYARGVFQAWDLGPRGKGGIECVCGVGLHCDGLEVIEIGWSGPVGDGERPVCQSKFRGCFRDWRDLLARRESDDTTRGGGRNM